MAVCGCRCGRKGPITCDCDPAPPLRGTHPSREFPVCPRSRTRATPLSRAHRSPVPAPVRLPRRTRTALRGSLSPHATGRARLCQQESGASRPRGSQRAAPEDSRWIARRRDQKGLILMQPARYSALSRPRFSYPRRQPTTRRQRGLDTDSALGTARPKRTLRNAPARCGLACDGSPRITAVCWQFSLQRI
ncbi:hypothetical protein FA95DRAFT_707112 [Auriscalpium vulgare]|uniref:Uncharacterized protein n=1 Tax=Auriscalpium vulgare TaxID=40419 RepID=A0ACB8S1A8_9AGAM|nr:hypothetical protein FA95DRAFT_707112 [Auriscalpium vulgare]